MTYLASRPQGSVASLHEVGSAQDIPESFLAKILQSLVHSGLAESQRGAHGGFALARPADEITLREVVEAVDGPVAINICVTWPDQCPRSSECTMHRAWTLAQEQLLGALDGVCLAALAAPPSAPAAV
jgi:Rrf2 family transcriptional regulator, iron-sulfur cluster assembly transcription factor